MNKKGFSLVEVLIASAVMMLVLILIIQGWRSSMQSTSLVTNKSELLEDARAAGQNISDFARNAVYVYPPGTALTLKTSTGGDYRVKNPLTLNNIWTVGQDSIVAFIEEPKSKTDLCDPVDPMKANNCLVFVAYYVLDRDDVVANAKGSENPGADPLNTGNGILYEYRLQLDLDDLSKQASVPPATPEKMGPPPLEIGWTGNFGAPAALADNIAPNPAGTPLHKFSLKSATCKDNKGLYIDSLGAALPRTPAGSAYETTGFEPGCPNTLGTNQQNMDGSLNYLASLAQASLSIETKRKTNMGNKFSSAELTFPISPQNLMSK